MPVRRRGIRPDRPLPCSGQAGWARRSARNLLAAGFEGVGLERTAERAAPLAADGARLGSSPAEAVDGCRLGLLTMLTEWGRRLARDERARRALEAQRPESVWIQRATVGDEWTERLATLATKHKRPVRRRSVSGSDIPARDRQLVVLASGPEEVQARLQPIFDAIGRRLSGWGRRGAGPG